MKFLILLLISFSSFANYIPESKIGTENLTVYMKQAKCQQVSLENCVKIDKDYSSEYSEIQLETQMKQEVEICLDEDDCQSKLEAKVCEKGFSIKNIDTLEIYCTWLRPKHVKHNEALKMAYDAKIVKKKNREGKIQKGKSRRIKCENFLSYVSGEFSDSDEASVDALTAQFSDIISAANGCKMKKLKRLLSQLDDSNFAELKNESLEILK
jgi:hypothetical protein